ncbi:MAG TPA: hypothetical protein VFW11_24365 [Cyclobacteriaceae bacterium]|nr:hypothetical protein [Cyclobacteriaceae bacterium]
MKRYYTLYYLLIMTMITGALASVARNNYGMKLIGFACVGFAFLFFFEALFDGKRRSQLTVAERALSVVELVALGGIALLLFFRSFFINIENATEGFTLLMTILTFVYSIYLFGYLRKWWSESKALSIGLLLYFLVLIVFLLTAVAAAGFHSDVYLAGPAAFALFILFVVWSIVQKGLLINGERTSIISHIWKMRNKSAIVLFAFVAVSLFFVLHRSNLIPPLYTSEKPAGYLHLVRQAEEGTEGTSAQEHPYELFDKRYKKFIKKYGN